MTSPPPALAPRTDAAEALPSPERLAAARVLVVGDAMLDRYWFGAVDRISPEAPVPVVRVTREEERLGGAANVALNVQALGAQATLMTAVGEDEPARRLRELLARDGVHTLLGSDPQLYTIVKLRVIGRAQQLIRIDFENQPTHEVLGAMLSDYERVLPGYQAVLFSDYGKGGLAHIPRMIEAARAAGIPVLVDPKGSDYGRYAGATVLTPNRAELAQVVGAWSGEADLHQRAHALRERLGLQALLLTRSEDGMSLFDTADGAPAHVHVPTQAREVFDVTGAGDTVIATLAALIAAGLTLREAMPLANRAAGLVVGRFGTASVRYDELRKELR
ncbi:D-glycero-beta-D-manno-heptose-7-phosphate kinase [Piscinibacter sakaiensis]|uniref:ADP-heptose synthase/D-glycero-beta-D-manno-heptose 7-phosphate kinase n=1 Tax=Piscinibacter sakaiensis TaxID=1547922 RepID=A0A0K8NTB8_PISS1|nr:D-glycero-beta-D-manno-heptose-7-phosphate kinase [Piscinibacter sakaiensis]GAP33608.1 ADP-heptose synthase/D-glycero-beta-D-manno-heptose 7-phosphate kinase [Piscinibacter sakaiensis]